MSRYNAGTLLQAPEPPVLAAATETELTRASPENHGDTPASAQNPARRHGGSVPWRVAANIAPATVSVMLFDLSVAGHQFLAARAFAVVFLLTIPGAVALAAAGIRFRSPIVRLGLVVSTSTLILMLLGWLMSQVLPLLGIGMPLARWPMTVAVNLLVGGCAAAVARRSDPLLGMLGSPPISWLGPLFVLGLALLPLASAAGAEELNNGHGGSLAAAAMLCVALVTCGLFAFSERVPAWMLSVALFCVALALLFSYSLRSNHLFGFDIQQEYQSFLATMRAGRWTPPADGNPYRAMLSITALPTVLARVTGTSGVYLFKVVYPALFAFFPALVFEASLRWLPRRSALVGAAYLIVLPQFAEQFPALARQEVGLLFFAVLLVLILDRSLSPGRRQAATIAALAGLVVSHYSTSYVTIAILVVTYLIYAAIRWPGWRSSSSVKPPIVTAMTVVTAVGLVVVWDVGLTHSTRNVTQFVASVREQGPDFLPNARGGSILTNWIKGNVGHAISPAAYYAEAHQAAQRDEPWLNTYPAAIWQAYPAQPPPPTPVAKYPRIVDLASKVETVCGELFLLGVGLGTMALLWRRFHGPPALPVEIAIFAFAFLVFVGFMRVSGVAAGAYNQERAQIHAGAVLCLGLGTSSAWFLRRWRTGTTVLLGAGLVIILISTSGLLSFLLGGSPPASLANRGQAYDQFFISDQEVAAAQWLGQHAGDLPVYTDQYGTLRLWDATGLATVPHLDLTPGTIPQGAWVYATAANIAGGRAYGNIDGNQAIYAFPVSFLDAEATLLYSSPAARIYR